jgi:hypothetical protein
MTTKQKEKMIELRTFVDKATGNVSVLIKVAGLGLYAYEDVVIEEFKEHMYIRRKIYDPKYTQGHRTSTVMKLPLAYIIYITD